MAKQIGYKINKNFQINFKLEIILQGILVIHLFLFTGNKYAYVIMKLELR